MKKLVFLLLIICLTACGVKNISSAKISIQEAQNFMSSSEKIEYLISEDESLNYLSNVLTEECVKFYGKTEYGIASVKIIDVSVENEKARIYVQFLYSGYSQKDNFFLRQASSNEQVAVIDIIIKDNGNNFLELTNASVIAISKNDNEYNGIVKDYFPQNKYLDVLKDRDVSLKDLQSTENLSVEDYLSSQNKQGMPYGDYDKYFSYGKK